MTDQSKISMHIGNKVNGVLKPLCSRRNIRAFMTPEDFVETAKDRDDLNLMRLCANCEKIGTRLYLPRKPEPEPDKAEAPRLL